MSEKRIGVFLPFQKRTIHAVKELNFDLEILKNDPNDDYYAITFQNAALCAKSISDIAQIPLLDEKGNLNGNTNVVLSNTQEFLNRNL